MRLFRKVVVVGFLGTLVATFTGCSGIAATQSVSPLMFLLPGFIKAKPAAPRPLELPADVDPRVLV